MEVSNILAYLRTQEIHLLTKDDYVVKHPDKELIFVQIRGPNSATQVGFNTQAVGASRGRASPYDVLSMVVYSFELKPLISIGRTKASDICIDNEAVSKFHASLRCLDDTLYLHDETSTYGTAVIDYHDKEKYTETPRKDITKKLEKGEKITLEDGMVIELGGAEFGTRILYLIDSKSKYDYVKNFDMSSPKEEQEDKGNGLLDRVRRLLG